MVGGDDERGVLPHVVLRRSSRAAARAGSRTSRRSRSSWRAARRTRPAARRRGRSAASRGSGLFQPVSNGSLKRAGAWKGSCGSKVSICSSQLSASRFVSRKSKPCAKHCTEGKSFSSLMNSRLIMFCEKYVAALLRELALVVHLPQPLPVRLHHRLPGVAFLAAHELVGVVAVVVGGAAVLPVVEVVGHEVAVDAGLVQQLGEGVVERLQRAPAAVQEGQAAGQHVAPGRHAGQAADIVVVEGDATRSPAGRSSASGCACRHRRRACAGSANRRGRRRPSWACSCVRARSRLHRAALLLKAGSGHLTAPCVSPLTM